MDAKEQITKWIEDFIIGHNICPFAKSPWDHDQVGLYECAETDFECVLDYFKDVLHHFFSSSTLTTFLCYFPKLQMEFLEFNDFSVLFEEMLKKHYPDKDFQLVVFHPNFYFADTDQNELANLVNCSPFPMIHCISNLELEKVMSTIESAKKISFNNEKRIKSFQPNTLKEIFYYKKL